MQYMNQVWSWGKGNDPNPWSGVQGYKGSNTWTPTLTPRYPYSQPLRGHKTPAISYLGHPRVHLCSTLMCVKVRVRESYVKALPKVVIRVLMQHNGGTTITLSPPLKFFGPLPSEWATYPELRCWQLLDLVTTCFLHHPNWSNVPGTVSPVLLPIHQQCPEWPTLIDH